jgi:hypothetical protein
MKLLIIKFSQTFCHFISLRSRYSLRHPQVYVPLRKVLHSSGALDYNILRVSLLYCIELGEGRHKHLELYWVNCEPQCCLGCLRGTKLSCSQNPSQ